MKKEKEITAPDPDSQKLWHAFRPDLDQMTDREKGFTMELLTENNMEVCNVQPYYDDDFMIKKTSK